MKKIIGIFILLIFFSCKKEKAEFIQSTTIKNLFLLKNPPIQDSLIKKEIKLFLLKNPPKYGKINSTFFYKYSSNTKYFLEHDEDPGGFSSEELHMYQDDDGIAVFMVNKCKNDTTKLVGELRYYNEKYGNFYQPDTIVFKCK